MSEDHILSSAKVFVTGGEGNNGTYNMCSFAVCNVDVQL